MKKINARNVPISERVGKRVFGKRVLRLAHETVRMLNSDELARAAGGSVCNTTSYTTESAITIRC